MDIKPHEDESIPLCIYCNMQIAAKRYELVRHSETKKHKNSSEPLNSINVVQLPICFTPAVVPVEKKCQVAQSLISTKNFFCLKIVVFLSEKTILVLVLLLRFFEKMKLYCTENVIFLILAHLSSFLIFVHAFGVIRVGITAFHGNFIYSYSFCQ